MVSGVDIRTTCTEFRSVEEQRYKPPSVVCGVPGAGTAHWTVLNIIDIEISAFGASQLVFL